MRSSRVWGFLFIALIVLFLIWFAAENWEIRRPGRDSSGPTVAPGQTE